MHIICGVVLPVCFWMGAKVDQSDSLLWNYGFILQISSAAQESIKILVCVECASAQMVCLFILSVAQVGPAGGHLRYLQTHAFTAFVSSYQSFVSAFRACVWHRWSRNLFPSRLCKRGHADRGLHMLNSMCGCQSVFHDQPPCRRLRVCSG